MCIRDRYQLARLVAELSDEGTEHLRAHLDDLSDEVRHVIVATHVPPFEQACLYQGEPTSPDFLPHFCNPSLGAMLVDYIDAHPDREMTVLCGHTHDRAHCQPHERINVYTAGAEYEHPAAAGTIDIDPSGNVSLSVIEPE